MEASQNGSRRRRGRNKKSGGGKIEHDKTKSETDEFDTAATSYRPHDTLLIQLTEDSPTWFECGKNLSGRDASIAEYPQASSSTSKNDALTQKYRSLADNIYRREVQLHHQSQGGGGSNNSDERWVENTMRKGTLKDRIAAMSVVVSSDPIHKFHALDGLLQLAGCGGVTNTTGSGQINSRVAGLAAEALEDLFLNTLLPPDRKLLTMNQRPLHLFEQQQQSGKPSAPISLSPRILLLWRLEEMIKKKYQLFLHDYFHHTLREGLDISKVAALRTAGTLLRSVPEGESDTLALMVNKLGDPGKKTAAAAGHELRRVLREHPAMQTVVAREVQQLVHRPHLSSRALYNCITFLNQLKLERMDDKKDKQESNSSNPNASLPASLIRTYFRLFEVAVNQTKSKPGASGGLGGDVGMKSRLLSALLTGVNRAHPYLPTKDQRMDEHVDALYRVAHTSPPAACTQALLLLFHLAVGSQLESSFHKRKEAVAATSPEEVARQERFYRALYSTLSNPVLMSHGKHVTMFFNLLYKAMKYDDNPTRVVAFAKRILCTTIHCGAPSLAASIFLVNEIASLKPELRKCLEGAPDAGAAYVVLDPAKREPRAALVTKGLSNAPGSKDESAGIPVRAVSWELSLAAHHYHPSVSKFASSAGDISYTGDPLNDFSIAPFLDKFAYRNPKAAQHKRGESVAQRRSFPKGTLESRMSLPVNDPSFLKKQDVEVQDEFFQKFFVERARRDEIKGISRGAANKDGSDDEDDAIDAVEASAVDKPFESFEQNWESDSEEEAFVAALAEKLMVESAGNAPVDVDSDPDMDGWVDLYEDDDDAPNKTEAAKHSVNTDSDSSDESEGEPASHGVQDAVGDDDDDAFMDDSIDDSGDDAIDDDSSGDPEADLAFISEGSSSDDSESDEEEAHASSSKKKRNSNVKEDASPFADSEEYEEMINKSWESRKRSTSHDEDEDKNEAEEVLNTKPRLSKKKKPKKHRN